MTISEIGTLAAIVISLIGAASAFLTQWGARRKAQAETLTESATTTKVKAEASAILVDSTMALASRLDEQILSLIGERDCLKKEREELRTERDTLRSEHDKQYMYLHTEIARTQEQLAIITAQFDECKQTLDLIAKKTGVAPVKPDSPREIN
jgi:chromosome segregation ATPase